MSVINSSLPGLTATRNLHSVHESLGRSLARLAADSALGDTSATSLADAGQVDSRTVSLQAATADTQTTLSAVQTADGHLAGMSDVLARLGDLARLAQGGSSSPSDLAHARQEFTALQDKLRATIGGSASEIGGTGDNDAPLGAFKGAALFGRGQDATANPADLRQGSMRSLISQDAAGAYNLNLSDPGAGATIADAVQQVASGRSSLGAAQSRLALAAAKLQVEQQNLSSVFPQIGNADTAQQATQFAQANILGLSGTALLAQAGLTPATVLNLLHG